jgi:hypothetical protein
MTDYTCPAEGCDYTAETTGSVVSHIHAKSGPEHEDKAALRAAFDKQTEESTSGSGSTEGQQGNDNEPEATPEAASEGGAGGGSADDDPEQDEQAADSGQEPANDHPESSPMPSDEEYDRLKSAASSQTTTPDEDTDTDPAPTDEEGGMGLPSLPVDPMTGAMLVGLFLMVVLAWYWVQSDGTDTVATENIEDEQPDGEDEVSLVQ